MDKLEALTALRDKVKAGDAQNDGTMYSLFGEDWLHCLDAYSGSLDAAKALHDAVLPGWCGAFSTDGVGQVWPLRQPDNFVEGECDDNPARAWLIALLEALIAQEPKP